MVMKLQHELKRPLPYASQKQEALLNLLRIGDQLDNRLSKHFRDHGLTLSRFNVLRSLMLEDRALTCGEIAERMIQVVPAITSLVDHLEQQGLVQRQRCNEDRRVVYVRITKQGKKLAEEVLEPLPMLENKLLDGMNRTELKCLIELLEKVRESIAACDDSPAPYEEPKDG
jgi:DNA-binding MarR family transcriptional regulator